MAPRAASLRTAAAPSVRIAQVQRTADALVAHAHLHDASKIATESRNSYIAIEDGHVRVVSSPTLRLIDEDQDGRISRTDFIQLGLKLGF